MPKIHQLSTQLANMIAAGEVVERPASVIKELTENAVDAGATQITVEIRDGGMTFMRVTDNGCGMEAEDAATAFLRHATSKLKAPEDLAAIETMGFRGEALAAIASVSRIDLLTKTSESVCGTSLTLEAGAITEQEDAGCPDGTTIIVRDLFFNTPARMKFMKSDTVEGSRITAVVQLQALAHPDVAFRYLRDGKEVLSTPGKGKMEDAVYCVYGRQCAQMIPVNSNWDAYRLTGYVSKPTDARPSRNLQTFFVNGRPVVSRLMVSALEEAYRNQIMVGKFPACVLHLRLPANAVDVNVHPAKTEVKFLNEKNVFDCIHYAVLGALNKTKDRPQIAFARKEPVPDVKPAPVNAPQSKQAPFFRTMTAEEYKTFAKAVEQAPQPAPKEAAKTAVKIQQEAVLHQAPIIPGETDAPAEITLPPRQAPAHETPPVQEVPQEQIVIQQELTLPKVQPWKFVGELYNTYIIVQQGEEAYLIDKHAAHERILFEKLKANQEAISSQSLLAPYSCRLSPDAMAALLDRQEVLERLGFEIQAFGENTLLIRTVPMDLNAEGAAEALEELADKFLSGKSASADTVRDEILHTVACKAAIKAGWVSDKSELEILAKAVMEREDLKYCPHGRPICVSLSKKLLEKQFKRI